MGRDDDRFKNRADAPSPRDRRRYRWLLRLLPFEFRAEFGSEMEEAFGELRREAAKRRWGWLRLWWDAVVDLARTAPGEHLDTLAQDVRYGVRSLRRSPALAAAALLTLVLGAGVHGAVYSVVRDVLLRPLPYSEPERLAMVWSVRTDGDQDRSMVSLQAFETLRDARSLAGLAVWNAASGNLTGGGEPERVRYALASDRLFAVLGVEPALGRGFAAGDDRPGRPPVAVVSDGFWRRRLGGDPAAVGRPLTLDGAEVTVIGVLPAGFTFPGGEEFELYRGLGLAGDDAGEGRWLFALARLAPGVGAAAAEDELRAAAAALDVRRPEQDGGWSVRLEPLDAVLSAETRPRLLTLWAMVAVVLLVAAANLAGLQLARGTAREAELAVRGALGARRLRIVRQWVTEGVLLGLAGGGGALALAAALLAWVRRVAPVYPEGGLGGRPIGLDGTAAAVLVGSALAASVAAVLPAAVRAARAATGGGLAAGARASSGRAAARARRALVAAEVALSLAALVAAGLLLRSFDAVSRLDPGFTREQLLTLRIEPPIHFAPDGEEMAEQLRAYEAEMARAGAFYDELLARIETIPGVVRAGAVNRRPLVGGWNSTFAAESKAPGSGGPPTGCERVVSPGYFEAAGVPLIEGRPLGVGDGSGAPRAAVVSRSLAAALWPGESPLGRRVTSELPAGAESAFYTVVGVVGDVRAEGLEADPPPVLYRTVAQARGGFFQDLGMDLVVRAAGDPRALVPAVIATIHAAAPELPVFGVATLDDLLAEELAPRRTLTLSVAAFAALALALAAIGLYGLLADSVGQRRREIGVRMALGARRGSILALVIGHGMTTVGAGLAAGLVAAGAAGRALAGQLYGIAPWDPTTFAATAALLAGVGLAAAWLPARRATATDPTTPLRGG